MSYFFVVDAKCKVLPKSSLPQDGSDFYFCRCVVPAASKEQAIADLTDTLRQDHTFIEEVFKVLLYKDAPWKEDDFEVHESF